MQHVKISILLLMIIFFGSCGSTEDEIISFDNILTAEIDGKLFTADEVILVQNTDPQSGVKVIVITASAGASSEEVMSFNLFNIGGTGTYPLGSNSNWASYTEDVLKTSEIFITPTSGGEITITEINDEGMKGTFEFEAYGSSENEVFVEEGKFEASF